MTIHALTAPPWASSDAMTTPRDRLMAAIFPTRTERLLDAAAGVCFWLRLDAAGTWLERKYDQARERRLG